VAAIYPAMMNSIFALIALGHGPEDPLTWREIKEFSKFEIEEEDTIRMQTCVSPIWDTCIAMVALEEAGVEEVWIYATHGLFCGDSLESFADDDLIKGLVVTDTVPIDPLTKPEKLRVLPVSGLLAETIMNVFADDSVSAIFGGENQLF